MKVKLKIEKEFDVKYLQAVWAKEIEKMKQKEYLIWLLNQKQ